MIRKWKLYYQELKLKEKVRIIFLGLMIIYLILIFSFLFLFVSRSSIHYLDGNSRTVLESSAENLNADFQTVSNMSLLIMSNSNVQKYLQTGKEVFSGKAIEDMREISAFFQNIYSIFLIRSQDEFVSVGQNTKMNRTNWIKEDWKDELDKRQGAYVVRLNGSGIFSTNTGEEVLSFMRQINDQESQTPIGYLVINIPMTVIEEAKVFSTEGKQQYSLEDRDGRVIGNYQNEEVDWTRENRYDRTIEKDLKKCVINASIFCAKDSLCIRMTNEIAILSLLRGQVNSVLIVLMIISIFVFFLIGTFITKNVTKPIEKLCESMENVKTGYFHRVSMKLPNNEIGRLKDTYNNMLIETNQLIQQLVDQEKRMRSAELEILQEQIKPHFLYNTLDMICYMVLEESREDVYDAVETLGNFYRKFLSKGKDAIFLEEEIGIVKDYLTLQMLRYEDSFDVEYELPQKFSMIRVPKLILQPFVENCIYHGVRLKGEKGLIKIKVEEGKERVEITIWDNGIGMHEDKIAECLKKENHKSFGLKGTIERLNYYYQQENLYCIRSKPGEFFEVHLSLPKVQ